MPVLYVDMKIYIETERLILREWQAADLPFFAAMNQDVQVMEFMLKPQLTFDETLDFYNRIITHFEEHGFGLFACELKETQEFMGFIGLSIPNFEAHFTPCVEIGWRLARKFWGKGYATEGATAVLKYGFEVLHLPEMVSFASLGNARSMHVMDKIGMHRESRDDFVLPLPPYPPCVLYRVQSFY